jgi:hypothetical protein
MRTIALEFSFCLNLYLPSEGTPVLWEESNRWQSEDWSFCFSPGTMYTISLGSCIVPARQHHPHAPAVMCQVSVSVELHYKISFQERILWPPKIILKTTG